MKRRQPQMVNRLMTSDGKTHEDEEVAFDHQQYLDFSDWYYTIGRDTGHELYADAGEVKAEDLYNWIRDNAETVKQILG